MSWEYYLKDKLVMDDLEIAKYFIKRDKLDDRSKGCRRHELVYKRQFLSVKLFPVCRNKTFIGNLFNLKHDMIINYLENWETNKKYADVQDIVSEYRQAFLDKSIKEL